MGLHEQPGQRLHGGDDTKAMPLPEPKDLGFLLLLGRGGWKDLDDAFKKETTPRHLATTL
jgi:hypothetical protein